jgi:hypothetical protein
MQRIRIVAMWEGIAGSLTKLIRWDVWRGFGNVPAIALASFEL